MLNPSLIPILVGVSIIAMFSAVGFLLLKAPGSIAEQRLDQIASGRKASQADRVAAALLRPSVTDLGRSRRWLESLPNLDGLLALYEQADVTLPFPSFLAIIGGLGLTGLGVSAVVGIPVPLWPVGGLFLAGLPILWLYLRKRRRIKAFTAQMPDALDLVGRALRAGHGLATGLRMVAEEMPSPIADEFGRISEEQNLGVPLEEAMRGMSERVPSMDVRFFVTAVIIQRATGGDLAEVLDKIGRIVRERFQILGQVQALTAEGRLSGIVLMAMPPALLAYVYWVNPSYASLLFSTELGTKMLAVAALLQLLGAVVIKKIVTIKV